MNLEETLQKMYTSDEENFLPLVNRMKRKAAKGLLEGVSPEEIDRIASEIQNNNSIISEPLTESEELMSMISETSQALFEYDKQQEETLENLSEEELESLAIEYMQNEILTEASDEKYDDSYEYYDMEDERKEKKKKIAKAAGSFTAGAATAIGSARLIKKLKSKAVAKKAAEEAAKASTVKTGEAAAAEAAKTITAETGAKAATVADSAAKMGLTAKALQAGKKVLQAGKKILTHPMTKGIGIGLGAAAATYGIAKLIKHIHKKRKEKMLAEDFSPELITATANWLLVLDEETFLEFYNDEDMQVLFDEALSTFDLDNEELNESAEELEYDTEALEEEVFNKPLFELLGLEE